MSRDKSPEPASNIDRRGFLKTVSAGAAGLALGAAGTTVFADEKKKTDQVKRRALGATGMEIATVVYGCGGLGVAHLPLLHSALEHGMNTFDVAWAYGRGKAELAVGKFVGTLKDREKVQIISKASGFKPRGNAKEVYRALKAAVAESLKRLQTDYRFSGTWALPATRTTPAWPPPPSPTATARSSCRWPTSAPRTRPWPAS